MRRVILTTTALCFAGTIGPRFVLAQGENAVPMRAGSFRFSIGAQWWQATERFGAPNPNRPLLVDGTREPLGIDYGSDSLGITQLPFLLTYQTQLRSLTGLGTYALNLGRSQLTLNASVRHQPIRLAWAPSRRLGFTVSVPIVRARMSAFLNGPDSTPATQGNVGLNSEFLTPGARDTFRFQADSALRLLQLQATSGPAGLRAQAQAELAALQPLLCGLSTFATSSGGDASSPCFTAGAGMYSALLPVVGSAAADSITARLASGQSSYATLRAQYAAQGVTLPPLDAAFALPATPLDSNDLRRLFSDPTGPLAGDSLTEVVRTGIGDIEVGGWFQIADRARFRSQLGLMVRLPTGTMDSPDNFIDIGTGDHQTDVEVALRNDLVLSRNLWLHLGGRYGVQMADQLSRRVTPWYIPLAPASSKATVTRNLGDYLAVDLVPNLQLDDAIGVGIGWHYFHQGATTYEYVNSADQARIGLNADVLGLATSVSRMRVGAGVTFSTGRALRPRPRAAALQGDLGLQRDVLGQGRAGTEGRGDDGSDSGVLRESAVKMGQER